MAQQTAVEWLWDLSLTKELSASDFEQAKEMEKQQIEDAWDNGNIEAGEECNIYCGEQYYNENYNK